MTEQVELLVDAKAQFGEGSIWDAKGQRLIWLDIKHRVLSERYWVPML